MSMKVIDRQTYLDMLNLGMLDHLRYRYSMRAVWYPEGATADGASGVGLVGPPDVRAVAAQVRDKILSTHEVRPPIEHSFKEIRM
jgi:hypothetical protein